VPIPSFATYAGGSVTVVILVALFIALIPMTIGALLSAIGIAGMDRLVRFNVLAMSGRSVEAAGDVDTLLLDKTGTITLGNRQATEFHPMIVKWVRGSLNSARFLSNRWGPSQLVGGYRGRGGRSYSCASADQMRASGAPTSSCSGPVAFHTLVGHHDCDPRQRQRWPVRPDRITPLTTPSCRRPPCVPTEQPAEMCLIVESAGHGQFAERHVAGEHEMACPIQASLDHIEVRRLAKA